jgi:hypothetical protein
LAELDDPLELGPSLDLDLSAPVTRAAVSTSHFGGLRLDSLHVAGPNITVAPHARANWPSGVSPDRERLVFDPADIRKVAGYGEPPSFALLAPFYAVRVTRRKQALKAALQEAERKLAAAEARREELLASITQRVRSEIERERSFQRALAPLQEIERLNGDSRARQRTPRELGAEHRKALADVARAVLAASGIILLESSELEAIREADENVLRWLRESEIHLRALDACDDEKVQLGFAVLIALCAGVLACVAYKVLLS